MSAHMATTRRGRPAAAGPTRETIDRPTAVTVPILAGATGTIVEWRGVPRTFHVTLVALGWCSAEERDAARRAVAKACEGVPPFRLDSYGIGHFHNWDRSIVYAQVAAPAIFGLRDRVLESLDRAGVQLPRRAPPFLPHISLATIPRGATWAGPKLVVQNYPVRVVAVGDEGDHQLIALGGAA